MPANTTGRVRFKRPDGSFSIDVSTAFNNPFYRKASWAYSTNARFETIGTWHLLYEMNGQLLVDVPVQVVASQTEFVNHPPNPITASLDPSSPGNGDVIFCRTGTSLAWRDPDFDIVRYRYHWSINGSTIREVTTAALSDAIPKGMANSGDILTCAVTPSDGALSGPMATVSVVVGCPLRLSSLQQDVAAGGGNGAVNLLAPDGCSWTARSTVDWVTVTSGAAGNGNGTVSYAVLANLSTAPRTGAITVQASRITITQAGIDNRPVITSASVSGKKLFVSGRLFADGAAILLDDGKQKTSNDEANPGGLLIAKKAGKKIARAQTVALRVRNPDGGLSDSFGFTRP
jgi:hypothetical protein